MARENMRHDRELRGSYHYLGKKHTRSRVDWNAEIQKTDRIGKRSFVITGLCFALTLAVMVGVNRTGVEISLPRRVLSVACIVLACFVVRATLRHRARVLEARRERETLAGQNSQSSVTDISEGCYDD